MLVLEPRWPRPTFPTSEVAEKLAVLCPGPSPARGLVLSLHPLSELALNAAWGLRRFYFSFCLGSVLFLASPERDLPFLLSLRDSRHFRLRENGPYPLPVVGGRGRRGAVPLWGAAAPARRAPSACPPVSTTQPADPYGTAWESCSDLGRQLRTLSRKSTERSRSESVNAVLWWGGPDPTRQVPDGADRETRHGWARLANHLQDVGAEPPLGLQFYRRRRTSLDVTCPL